MAENPADIKSIDYLAALVRKVSQLKEVPKNILHADEVRKIQGDPAALAKFIDGKPHLQEQLASLTNFTPSQWLLAQEIPAIRRRRFLQTKNDYTFDPIEDDPYEWAQKKNLQGICFSGGGIAAPHLTWGSYRASPPEGCSGASTISRACPGAGTFTSGLRRG